ncbi:MAG: hypothetical protein KKG76_11530 [Euryarchaeota archaeon]|nr:hypothetical protein [Euryarchaeota archaeon]
MPHHTGAPSGSPVSGSRLPGNWALRRYAFRSLDAGAERHGGVWSRWEAGVGVFMGGCFVQVSTVVLA